MVMPPIRTMSKRPFSNVRTSSGLSNRLISTMNMTCPHFEIYRGCIADERAPAAGIERGGMRPERLVESCRDWPRLAETGRDWAVSAAAPSPAVLFQAPPLQFMHGAWRRARRVDELLPS